jgi:hypothetical protein
MLDDKTKKYYEADADKFKDLTLEVGAEAYKGKCN